MKKIYNQRTNRRKGHAMTAHNCTRRRIKGALRLIVLKSH